MDTEKPKQESGQDLSSDKIPEVLIRFRHSFASRRASELSARFGLDVITVKRLKLGFAVLVRADIGKRLASDGVADIITKDNASK